MCMCSRSEWSSAQQADVLRQWRRGRENQQGPPPRRTNGLQRRYRVREIHRKSNTQTVLTPRRAPLGTAAIAAAVYRRIACCSACVM